MNNHLKGILMVLSATAMWGLVGILVQYLINSEQFTPEWLVNTRLLASGIILLIITYFFYERNIFQVLKTDFFSLMILGIVGLLGSQYGFFLCLHKSQQCSYSYNFSFSFTCIYHALHFINKT